MMGDTIGSEKSFRLIFANSRLTFRNTVPLRVEQKVVISTHIIIIACNKLFTIYLTDVLLKTCVPKTASRRSLSLVLHTTAVRKHHPPTVHKPTEHLEGTVARAFLKYFLVLNKIYLGPQVFFLICAYVHTM